MNKEKIREFEEKLEGAKFGIICTNKGTVVTGTGMELLNVLSNIVFGLKEELPKKLVLMAVNNGLKFNKETKGKDLKTIEKILELLKELQ